MIQEAAPRISVCTYTCNVAEFNKQSDFSCRCAQLVLRKLNYIKKEAPVFTCPLLFVRLKKKDYFLSSVIATDKTLSLQNSKKKRHLKLQKINLRQQYYAAFSLLYLLHKRQDYGINIIIQDHSAYSFLGDIKRKKIKMSQSLA